MNMKQQLTYQQKMWICNSFDDIMEYTIVCKDPMEPEDIVAEIKDEVDYTFSIKVPKGLIYKEIETHLYK